MRDVDIDCEALEAATLPQRGRVSAMGVCDREVESHSPRAFLKQLNEGFDSKLVFR